jgi:serpin B
MASPIGLFPFAVAVAALVGSLCVVRAQVVAPRPVNPATTLTNPEDSKRIDADNAFGLNLFGVIAKGQAGRSLCLSPISAALALQMAYNGAVGQTQTEMATALGLQGEAPEAVSRSNATLLAELENGDPAVTLRVANSIWVGDGGAIAPRAEFVQRCRDDYHATVGNLLGAPGTINAWVRKATNDKIDSIVGESDLRNVVAVLVNAVYFKGTWSMPFDKAQTRDAVFHMQDGSRRDVKMMNQSGHFGYARGDGFQAVRLPYHGQFSALLFLPDEGRFTDFMAHLTPENWRALHTRFRPGEGHIGLPRFRAEYTAALNGPLKELGMGVAFRPGAADFSNLAGRPGEVWIGAARQKTYIDVNEEGTEAAAATGVVMSSRAVMVMQHFDLTFDRPFVYAIQDDRTGALLFLGTMEDPTNH